LLKTYC